MRKPPAWLTAIFLLAIAARALFVFGFGYLVSADDSELYRTLAENLVERGTFAAFGHPTAFVTPGYPIFLAGLYLISRSTTFIAAVQVIVGAFSVVLLALAAKRFAGKAAGVATGLIAAVYPHLLFWTGYVLTETLYIFFISLSLFFLARSITGTDRGWWAFATGLSLGVGALVRPVLLGFALAISVFLLVVRETRRSALFALAGVVLTISPWVVRNAITLDALIVTSTESGIVLWQGNSPGATGGSRGYVDAQDFDFIEMRPGTSEVESDAIYRSRALEWMRSNPDRVLELVPKKMWNMWRPTYDDASRLNRVTTYTTYPIFLILAGIGLFVAARRGAFGVALVIFLGYHLVAHSLITGMIRFRAPVEAGLAIPAGIATVWIAERLLARRRGTGPNDWTLQPP